MLRQSNQSNIYQDTCVTDKYISLIKIEIYKEKLIKMILMIQISTTYSAFQKCPPLWKNKILKKKTQSDIY